MVNTMEVPEKDLKKLKEEIKTPLVKTFQTAIFRAFTKTKVLVFIHFDSCPRVVVGKLHEKGNKIIIVDFRNTH